MEASMNRSTVLALLFCLITSTAHASRYSLTDYGITSSEIYLNNSGQVEFSPNNSFAVNRGPYNFGYVDGNLNNLQILNTQTAVNSEITGNSFRGNTPTGPITGEMYGLLSNSSGIIVGTVGVNDEGSLAQAWVANLNAAFNPIKLIPIPSGFDQLLPLGINSTGLIVGQAVLPNASTRAFLYDGTTTVDLNSLIPPNSGLTLTSAVQIGDLGQIVGYAVDASGNTHAVLLTPTAAPEPSSLFIAFCSMCTFSFVIRRRKSIVSRRSVVS
jgi:probable HAF family extracellular repeat protein